jgi:U32 family peptidase
MPDVAKTPEIDLPPSIEVAEPSGSARASPASQQRGSLVGRSSSGLSSALKSQPCFPHASTMNNEVELLAPGGDIDSIKAAVVAGADAVYCGLLKFNARNRAANISFDDLPGVIRLAHRHGCKVYLTLNIIFVESDLSELISLLNKLANTDLDGVIVQDVGLMYLLSEHYPGLRSHASTQLTTHNVGQIDFLARLAATRANLSRELSINEITELTAAGHARNLSTEVFVHGSYCLSFSGLCYLSSVHSGRSGNRGKCSQPCRDRYLPTRAGKDYPLNLKDNSAFGNLRQLTEAGVAALKIEGRGKGYHYVYAVTRAYRAQLQNLQRHVEQKQDSSELHEVFNRGFSNGFLMGDVNKSMFADHPRNRAADDLRETKGSATGAESAAAFGESLDEIADNRRRVKEIIDRVSVARAPLTIRVSGTVGTPLRLVVQTPDTSFEVLSESRLTPQGSKSNAGQLTHETLLEKLKTLSRTEYFIEELDLGGLQRDLFVPFRELTLIRKRILFLLRGSKAAVEPIELSPPPRGRRPPIKPTLAVLISSREDLHLGRGTRAELHFQLPSCLKDELDGLVDLFRNHGELVPWFPPVLIGEDYAAALDFLDRARPGRVVTNNTGIAFQAWRRGIPWIAGPDLNTANSYSLLCLKERFDCTGAFLSNELSQDQLRRISPPEGFGLHYRLYHPIVLLTSRQCLFHQVTGCEKDRVDETCLRACDRSASITSTRQATLLLKKTPGHFASIYHETHFLNPTIVADLPDTFSSFLVDLRDIETETRVDLSKSRTVQLFEQLLEGRADSLQQVHQRIQPTTSAPYLKGM